MNLLLKLPEILEESKKEYEDFMDGSCQNENRDTDSFLCEACFGSVQNGSGVPSLAEIAEQNFEGKDHCENMLAQGDNLDFMKYLLKEKDMAGKIQLIYIDPPFFSKAKYEAVIKAGKNTVKCLAYDDLWKQGIEEYLRMFCRRAFFLKELLSDSGCIWVHLDWHAVHYIKILMDEIFGEKNFINEIIWTYKSGGTGKRSFSKKHDTLLFYSKTGNYYFSPQKEKSYNRALKPYRFKGVKEYKDETGWYTLVNRKDVWNIDMVGRTAGERTGYATQKPAALLERILESCSRPGDICADFFSGSGVLAKVAADKDRRFISCDAGALAIGQQLTGLIKAKRRFSLFTTPKQQQQNRSEETMDLNGSSAEITGWYGKGYIKFTTHLLHQELTKNLLVNMALTDYSLDVKKLPLCDGDKKVIENLPWEELIAGWSADFDNEGICHVSQAACACGQEALCREITGRVSLGNTRDLEPTGESKQISEITDDKRKRISLMIIDIFGNRRYTVLTLEDRNEKV